MERRLRPIKIITKTRKLEIVKTVQIAQVVQIVEVPKNVQAVEVRQSSIVDSQWVGSSIPKSYKSAFISALLG